MNDEIDPAAQPSELTTNPMTLQQHALQEIDKVAAGIDALATKYKGVVFDVATTKGLDEAKAARVAIREPRYEVERVRKATASDLKKIATAVNERAASITESIRAIEDPIDAQIKGEEERKEAEREAKRAAEAERIAAMNARLDNIRNMPLQAVGASAEELQQAIERVAGDELDGFDEVYLPTAQQTRDTALDALNKMLAERQALNEQQAELARLRAEQEARDAEAAEQRRIADEAAQAERDRLAAEAQAKTDQEAQERRQAQEREDAERRERQAAEDRQRAEQAEADRIERERVQAEQEARQAKLDAAIDEKRAKDEAAEQERLEAAQRAEDERLARLRDEAEQREQERVAAQQAAVEAATVRSAAEDALECLREHVLPIDDAAIDIITLSIQKLEAALEKEPQA